MREIKITDIAIAPNRQRREFDQAALIELSGSISRNGLLHPVVVRNNAGNGYQLVAGERRLKAIEQLWIMGDQLRCGDQVFLEPFIPCTYLGDLDPIDAFEAELEENIRRTDITWQERSEAAARLFDLRSRQAARDGIDPPSAKSIAAELRPSGHPVESAVTARKELIVSRYLSDPDVASAKTLDEGFKVIKRKEETARNVALGESVGRVFNAQSHTLLLGDCLAAMKSMNTGTFDCILSDPPYGIGAQDFNDSGGKANAAGHAYDDSYSNWLDLIYNFAPESFRVTKPAAHLYLFCDVDNFLSLRSIMVNAGWRVFRTPLVWHNPSSQRAPWPQHGPHRRWQMCLYALKGDRPVLKLAPDVLEYRSDENLGWAAQKPVGLYSDLLSRSCRAGDSVLDPFAGSGTIFPAAHGLKIKATGVEMDSAAYGIAVKRIGELK